MMLLCIVLALILERLLSSLPAWRSHALFAWNVRAVHARLGHTALWSRPALAPALLAALILPTLVLVGVAQWWFVTNQLGLPTGLALLANLAFDLFMLLLTLGPRHVAQELHALLDARERGDTDAAESITRDLRSTPASDTELAGCQSRSLLGSIFIQLHERLFAVLLWFFALGPVGAVGYRMVAALPRVLADPQVVAAQRKVEPGANPSGANPLIALTMSIRLHRLMAWVPQRISALLLALAGSTDDALAERKQARQARADGWRLLAATGAGALNYELGDSGPLAPSDLDEGLRSALALRLRALLLLLAALAIPTLAGVLI